VCFLDGLLFWYSGRLPRGYYYDVAGRGYEQLCLPLEADVQSPEEAAAVFARDVADGLLEEFCAALDPGRSARLCTELGL
jgi:hypothetical protein